ncbi:MAG: hypothetical protein KKF65_05490 [Nanoarchaeota archaeon]|nr:hypothetical protein [Nanoarchaeota archaeon]
MQSSVLTNYTITNNITRTLTPATYVWKINCSDSAHNFNLSSENTFVITTEDDSDDSGNSGGSSTGSTESFANGTINNPISLDKLTLGYTKDLYKGNVLYFNNSKKEKHSIKLNDIKNKTINLTIESTPITIILSENESKKLNISSVEYLDLLIEVIEITGSYAKITIKEINEKNLDYIAESPERTYQIQNETSEELTSNNYFPSKQVLFVVLVPIILFIFIILSFLFKKRSKKEENQILQKQEKPIKKSKSKKQNKKAKN